MNAPFSLSRRAAARGFSLVELLVVLLIISVMVLMALPSMKDVQKSSKLTQAGDQIRYDIAQGLQTAVKDGLQVEVRFYRFSTDPKASTLPPGFAAYQFFQLRQDVEQPNNPLAPQIARPITKLRRLPEGVLIVASEKWSTLMSDTRIRHDKEIVRGLVTGQKETESEFVSFRITSDGETDLEKTGRVLWFMTLVNETELRGKPNADDMAPKNFITLQLDPFNTGIRWWQPG